MYTIYCDGELLYSPNVTDSYPVSDAVLKQELNRADSLTFKMYQNHPLYGSIDLMKSTLVVFDGDEPISILRPIAKERDFNNNLKYTCEGCLAFFNDSIVPVYAFVDSGTMKRVSAYLTWLMNNHNSQIDDDYRKPLSWSTNLADVLIKRENHGYPTTFDEVREKLLDMLGGYFLPKYTKTQTGLAKFSIEYNEESGTIGSQTIQFGRNLVNFSEYIDRTDRITRLVPLGQKEDGSEDFLTVYEAFDERTQNVHDSIFVDAPQAYINLYGILVGKRIWEDVTNKENLLAKAQDWIEDYNEQEPVSITIGAADLSYLTNPDNSVLGEQRFRIGQINQVVSEPHGINEPFRCSALQIKFDNLAQNVYTFGEVRGTLTRMI